MVAVAAPRTPLRPGPFLDTDNVAAWLDGLGELDGYAMFADACAQLEAAGASPEAAVILVLRRAGEEVAATRVTGSPRDDARFRPDWGDVPNP